tara:strand:- start:4314 stop:5669 length:1356 start_codon:yes stop_codon:yes gene_type:complete
MDSAKRPKPSLPPVCRAYNAVHDLLGRCDVGGVDKTLNDAALELVELDPSLQTISESLGLGTERERYHLVAVNQMGDTESLEPAKWRVLLSLAALDVSTSRVSHTFRVVSVQQIRGIKTSVNKAAIDTAERVRAVFGVDPDLMNSIQLVETKEDFLAMCHTVRLVHSPRLFNRHTPIKYIEREAVVTHVVVGLLGEPRTDLTGSLYELQYDKRLPELQVEGVALKQGYRDDRIIATLYEDGLRSRHDMFFARLADDVSSVLWDDQASGREARHKRREDFVAQIKDAFWSPKVSKQTLKLLLDPSSDPLDVILSALNNPSHDPMPVAKILSLSPDREYNQVKLDRILECLIDIGRPSDEYEAANSDGLSKGEEVERYLACVHMILHLNAKAEEEDSCTFYDNFRHYCYYEPTRRLLENVFGFCLDDDGPGGDWVPEYERQHYRMNHGHDPDW